MSLADYWLSQNNFLQSLLPKSGTLCQISSIWCCPGLVVTHGLHKCICSTSGPVNTWMGDHLWASKTSRYVTSRLGQLSLPSFRGRYIDYKPFWLGFLRIAFTCVGWQVTLCDPIWQVMYCSSEVCTRRATSFNLQPSLFKLWTSSETVYVLNSRFHC